MKIYTTLRAVMLGFFVTMALSCDNSDESSSVITKFEEFPLVIETAAVTSAAEGDTLTFQFSFDNRQINDVHIVVGVGEESTAVEDVDFALITHDIELDAFEGMEGFSLDVAVLQDGEIEEGDEETVYLTFTSEDPSGFQKTEFLALSIKDSGLLPQPADAVDFTLRWEFANTSLGEDFEVCTVIKDLDLTIQPEGDPIYGAGDAFGYEAATLNCPESGTLTVSSLVDGAIYEGWVAIYAGLELGDFDELNVYVDYSRENSDFNGTFEIEGVFDATMEEYGNIMFTLQRNGNELILKDMSNNVISSGRVATEKIQLQKVYK